MRVKLTSILTTIIVNSVLTSARSPRLTGDRLEFHNLFDSIAKNDEQQNEAYREIVKHDIEEERKAFDVIKGELMSVTKVGNIHASRNSHQKSNIAKRNTMPIKREVIVRRDRWDDETNKMMRLPVAGDNFERCVQKNKIIVDKTLQMKKMLTDQCFKLKFITRPPGFGKSFFINMLECFFLNKKHLFKDTALYNETIPEYPWQEYAVVKIDFEEYAGLRPDTFEKELCRKLRKIGHEYHVEPAAEHMTVGYQMGHLLRELDKKGRKIVLLIDECDSPNMHAVLAKDRNEKAISHIMHNFYAAIEHEGEKYVFGLLTGRYSLPRYLSRKSMIKDLSLEPEFHDLVGFTKSEIDQYYADLLHQNIETRRRTSSKTEIDRLLNEIHQNLTSWYNDYRFTPDETKLYSPLSVVKFLNELPSEMKTTKWATTVLDSPLMKTAMKLYPVEMISFAANNEDGFCHQLPSHPLRVEGLLLGEHFHEVLDLLYQEGYVTIADFENEHYDVKCANKESRISLWESLRHTLLPVEENWLELLQQRDFQSFFSRMEKCIPRHYRQLSAYDTLLSFCLSNGDLDEMTKSEIIKTNEWWTDREYSEYVLENSQYVFVFEYACTIESTSVKGKKIWAELCEDEHRRKYLNIGKRAFFCTAIQFQQLKDSGMAQPSRLRKILNWSVRGFAENGSVIEEYNRSSSRKKLIRSKTRNEK